MNKIMITGGAGFIGSHLCDYFHSNGYEIVCIDNLITGRLDNLRRLLSKSRFRFIKRDITKPVPINLVKGKITALLHLASPASPQDYLKYPIETLKTGSFGTFNALEFARLKKAMFLLASTSEVYGDPLKHPQDESYWGNVNPVGPRSVYDESKRFAEALTMAYRRKYKLDTKIARIFNTYGPRMRLDDGRALPNFFGQSLRNNDITIYGDGKQTRSFCYVSDMVDGLVKLLRSNQHQPVNLGNPEEIKVLQLASEIKEITNSKSRIKFLAIPADDPHRRKPDISKAVKTIGWRPHISRLEGLRKTLDYFRGII